MNEIKDKLISYFEQQDNKNLIMLILSVLIAMGIAIYYLNDYFSQQNSLLENKKIKIYKKIKKIRNLNSSLGALKHKNRILKTKFKNLSSDWKFLLSEIETSDFLIVDNEKFLKILHNYIKMGTKVNASFEIENNNKKLNRYNMSIKGDFKPNEFFNFTDFIKTIQSPKAIISINSLNVKKDSDIIDYDMNVSIWSFK